MRAQSPLYDFKTDITRPNCALDRRTICVSVFLDCRDKSLNELKFCRNDQRKVKNKGSVLVAESAYNAQNAQFGLIMEKNQ